MKHKMIAVLCMAGLMALGACSSEEDSVQEKSDHGKIALDASHFSFTEEEYDADQTMAHAKSRAVVATPQPKTIDLGDDIFAEVSVETGTDMPKTRATKPLSDGQYTICAYDADHYRQGELTGTVSGGVFTSTDRMLLDPDVYDFVCYNSTVIPLEMDDPHHIRSYDYLQVENGMDNPMMGFSPAVNISGDEYFVPFHMKHKAMRVRLKIISEPEVGDKVSATIMVTPAAIGTGGYWRTIMQIFQRWDGTEYGSSQTSADYAHFNDIPSTKTATGGEYLSPYEYLMPPTSTWNYLNRCSIRFDKGEIFGRSLVGKTIDLSTATFPAGYTEQENSTVTIKVKIKVPPHYLFQDGTVGTFANRGTRTPIGLVVTEKVGSNPGLAAALNVLSAPLQWENEVHGNSGDSYQNNTVCYPTPTAGLADMNGYNWTWDGSSSLDGKVRANEASKYPAFYAAAHYNPGVTVTGANVGKWFMPSFGQLVKALQLTAPDYKITDATSGMSPWMRALGTYSDSEAPRKLDRCLIVGGGTGFHGISSGFIQTSTQVDGTSAFRKYQPTAIIISELGFNQIFVTWKTMMNGNVWPFVEF